MAEDSFRGINQDQLVAKLKESWSSLRLWGPVYNHRLACVRFLQDEVYRRLDDPTMTRSRMKREMDTVFKRVEEFGPP